VPKFLCIFLAVSLLSLGGAAILGFFGENGSLKTPPATLYLPPENLPEYGDVRQQIETRRRDLANSLDSDEQEATLALARELLGEAISKDLTEHWLGTPWDFNGVSQTPGRGQIACGYFVSTVLRDAGFQVERVRLAQQASGNIIRSLTGKNNIVRMVGRPFDEFVSRLKAEGPGIYVIGLDYHVGFIAQDAEGAVFIHSDGGAYRRVVAEPVETAAALRRSRWREFANISADDALLERWLRGGEFATKS
jgi:hypothetical protein